MEVCACVYVLVSVCDHLRDGHRGLVGLHVHATLALCKCNSTYERGKCNVLLYDEQMD